MATQAEDLLEKIKSLPLKRQAEVEDFEEKQLKQAALKISEASFAKVWDNPEDSIYDSL